MPRHAPSLAVMLLAVVAAASTWFYVNHVMRAEQIADAIAHQRPRGNLSDLYPRWLGTRELLVHRRNPYGPEITREIQQGYYGRPLDPKRADDPKDQQGFAYPAYVVFLLAPSVGYPFETVQTFFRWVLIALAGASVLLWLRVVRWNAPVQTVLTFVILAVGWLPMVQGIKLQQLSLLVAALIAASGACLVSGWFLCAGGLLALATIKPQLAWPVVLWLFVWAASDWRARRRFLIGFGIVMLLLLGGAEFLLPGWLRMFLSAIGEYHRYTQNQSVLVWMFGTVFGRILELGSILASAACLVALRKEPSPSPEFGRAFALVMALTVVIVPMFAPYNQVLLIPAILVLVRSGRSSLPALRIAGIVGAVLVIWPWIAAFGLSVASIWLTPQWRSLVWPMPFYSNFLLPIFVFGLILLNAWLGDADGLRDSALAE